MTRKVALIRGDGTGPELIDAMLKVIEAASADVEFVHCEAGLGWWEKHGGNSMIPEETWQKLHETSACVKGPATTPTEPSAPRSVAVSIRQRFDLYANVRPVKTFRNRVGPLGEVDFVCVREGTEGLYSGIEYRLSDDVAIAIRKITRSASERIARFAFKHVSEKGWENLVAISKANILRESCGVFLEAVRRVAKEFAAVRVEEYFVDNIAQQLVKNPQRFNHNVLLSTNLFMDILSEEASALIGSIGTLYSANFGDAYAMFEPAHGSSPKYRGQNKVNPTATILSGAWMLDYVGQKEVSRAIFEATEQVIADGKTVTYDLAGEATTQQMAEAVSKSVRRLLRK